MEPRDYSEPEDPLASAAAGTDTIKRFELSPGTSGLYRQLYGNVAIANATANNSNDCDMAECDFKSVVVLDSSVACDGMECEVDLTRVVKLANAGVRASDGTRYNVYYKYVRRSCIKHTFFADASVVTGSGGPGATGWVGGSEMK